jgi:hypothetical protein
MTPYPTGPRTPCERCGKRPAMLSNGGDVTPQHPKWVCEDCHDALQGRDVARWQQQSMPDFPHKYYPDIKDIDSMTDDQARQVYRTWGKTQNPGLQGS